MRLRFLATGNDADCIPGCQRASFTLEAANGHYLFDAGSHCALTAYRNGVDLPDVRAVFIAHPGMAHIAGLPDLLWAIRRLSQLHGRKPDRDMVHLFMPYIRPWRGMLDMLESAMKNSIVHNYILEVSELANGAVFENEDVAVRARTTQHFTSAMVGMDWRAYSFAIEAGGKTLAYTGEVANLGMLGDLLAGCDILLAETVHQEAGPFCAALERSEARPARIVFLHADQPPLQGDAAAAERIAERTGAEVVVARDDLGLDL